MELPVSTRNILSESVQDSLHPDVVPQRRVGPVTGPGTIDSVRKT
jgi:hypothetical protein